METKQPIITKIQHVGIPTSNLTRSQEFYEGLNFKNVMAASFKHNEEEGKVVMMKSGDVIIEIYQLPGSDRNLIHPSGNRRIDHIAFDVSDINITFKSLKAAGYNVIEDSPVFLPFWKNGCRYFNILGPEGERIEFNQILEDEL